MRAFGHGLHGASGDWMLNTKSCGLGWIDLPLNGEIDVDDVLVARQHEAFLKHVARSGAATGIAVAVADLRRVDDGDARLDDAADRIREIVVQARLGGAGIAPENQVQADFVGANGVETRRSPKEHGADCERDHALAAHLAAGHHLTQLVLAAPQQFFEVGRRTASAAATLRTATPRTGLLGTPGSPATAATLIAPRHSVFPLPLWSRSSRPRRVFSYATEVGCRRPFVNGGFAAWLTLPRVFRPTRADFNALSQNAGGIRT